jgi:hypothetical protein
MIDNLREKLQKVGMLLEENQLKPERDVVTDALFQLHTYEILLNRCVTRFSVIDTSNDKDSTSICALCKEIAEVVNKNKKIRPQKTYKKIKP